MTKLAIVLLLVSATAAFAQTDCPVCEQAAKLRSGLQKIRIDDAGQKAQGEALSREGLALVAAFQNNPPPPGQGRKTFESLVALSLYAAPFSVTGDYEKALAAIGMKNPDYRKRFQAIVRKGLRAKNRRESCQIRYLQTNVSVQECKLQEAASGASGDLANKRCNASYSLGQCLAKSK